MSESRFIFRKVVHYGPADSDRFPHGLVNVYERSEPDHVIGQLHPAKGGGYLLRDRDGVNLAEFDGGRTPGFTPLSREPSARLLQMYVAKQEIVSKARIGSVSEACPNKWHNTADYRIKTACPECPSQIGLRLAAKLLDREANIRESGGDDPVQAREYAAQVRDLLYVDPS